MTDLKGSVIVITGASAGIGEDLALTLAPQGCRLVLAARSEGPLEALAHQVRQRGSEALVVPTDMKDSAQIKALAQRTLAHYGTVDALINNAGYGQYGPISELTEDQIRSQFDLNVIGLVLLTQHLIPTMRTQRRGRIINISSIAGLVTLPFGGIYHASKHAVESITDALRMELAPFGIYVSAIEPGPVATNFFKRAQEKASDFNLASSPYAPILPKFLAQLDKFEKEGVPVAEITRMILLALTQAPPQDRYIAYKDGVLLGLFRTFPVGIKDTIFKSMFGLDQPL